MTRNEDDDPGRWSQKLDPLVMSATHGTGGEASESMTGYVITRATTSPAAQQGYLRSIHIKHDGTIVAIAYGMRHEACIFSRERAAGLLVERIAGHPIFGFQSHRIERLASAPSKSIP